MLSLSALELAIANPVNKCSGNHRAIRITSRTAAPNNNNNTIIHIDQRPVREQHCKRPVVAFARAAETNCGYQFVAKW